MMSRVAVVTGGTRGIGAAISKALLAAGYKVAATYFGNDEAAAKAGDLGFVKALAQEGARAGITVNAICPGYIATEMVKAINPEVLAKNILPQIPVGRLGEPEEIGRAVVFLAADESGFITGATLSANGGQYFA